jgi:uncharacterized protein
VSVPVEVAPAWLRRALVSHHGLARDEGVGAAGIRAMLAARRCVQLDPLDPLGTNADLVALARVAGVGRDDVYDAVLPGHGFEHFAKERCLLPASAFPAYRDRAREVPWWRTSERMKRLDEGLIEDVLAEVRDRGPIAASALSDRGRVEPLDWSGWRGTSRASAMALEVLWVRCRVVVSGRRGNAKVYDVPERALPEVATAPFRGDFSRWALLERVEAAGCMPTSSGPVWGQIEHVRAELTDALAAEGAVERVTLPGTRRQWLVPAGFFGREVAEPDERMRILGPLDPLLWDRTLVRLAFGFDYVWEVYKPAAKRQWGWYVCPLLHRGELVGRIDARHAGGEIQVARRWVEEGASFDEDAYRRCLEAHAAALA